MPQQLSAFDHLLQEARETRDVLGASTVFIRGIPNLLRAAIDDTKKADKNLRDEQLFDLTRLADYFEVAQPEILAAITENTPIEDPVLLRERRLRDIQREAAGLPALDDHPRRDDLAADDERQLAAATVTQDGQKTGLSDREKASRVLAGDEQGRTVAEAERLDHDADARRSGVSSDLNAGDRDFLSDPSSTEPTTFDTGDLAPVEQQTSKDDLDRVYSLPDPG